MSEMTGLLNGGGETRSCPGCKVAMRLVGIEPHHLPTSNDNIYTFECVVCGMTTAEAVSASTLTELMGDISLTVSPIKDARGKIASKIARDITERRKRADAQIVILAREAEHRAKNILANVQAAVRLSRSDTPEGLKQSIEGRIQALANVHRLFVQSRWAGADLHSLIKEELSPYCELDEKRASIEGPALLLKPDMAQAMAVTLHELTTNAAKYGALSVPEGRVQIAWSCSPAARHTSLD